MVNHILEAQILKHRTRKGKRKLQKTTVALPILPVSSHKIKANILFSGFHPLKHIHKQTKSP